MVNLQRKSMKASGSDYVHPDVFNNVNDDLDKIYNNSDIRALPRATSGDQINDCDATTGWTESGQAAAISVTTDRFQEGTGSLKMKLNASGAAVYELAFGSTDMSAAKKIYLNLYRAFFSSLVTSIEVRLGSDDSNYHTWTLTDADKYGKWVVEELNLFTGGATGTDKGSDVGTPNDAAIDYFAIIITGTGDFGNDYLYTDDIRWAELEYDLDAFSYNVGGTQGTTSALVKQALAASNTNYIEVDSSGVVTSNTSGFTATKAPIATIVTDANEMADPVPKATNVMGGSFGGAFEHAETFTSGEALTAGDPVFQGADNTKVIGVRGLQTETETAVPNTFENAGIIGIDNTRFLRAIENGNIKVYEVPADSSTVDTSATQMQLTGGVCTNNAFAMAMHTDDVMVVASDASGSLRLHHVTIGSSNSLTEDATTIDGSTLVSATAYRVKIISLSPTRGLVVYQQATTTIEVKMYEISGTTLAWLGSAVTFTTGSGSGCEAVQVASDRITIAFAASGGTTSLQDITFTATTIDAVRTQDQTVSTAINWSSAKSGFITKGGFVALGTDSTDLKMYAISSFSDNLEWESSSGSQHPEIEGVVEASTSGDTFGSLQISENSYVRIYKQSTNFYYRIFSNDGYMSNISPRMPIAEDTITYASLFKLMATALTPTKWVFYTGASIRVIELNNYGYYRGIAKSTVGSAASVDVTMAGVNSNQSGLMVGKKYMLSQNGLIPTGNFSSVNAIIVGCATSATEILLNQDIF